MSAAADEDIPSFHVRNWGELAGGCAWTGGAVFKLASTLGSSPAMIAARLETDDAQDQGKWHKWLGAGDGRKDAGLGLAFRKPLAGEAEAGSSKQGKQEANNSSKESCLLLPAGCGIQHTLLVQAEGLGGDHRTEAALSPGGNRRARDLDVPGDGLGAAANDVFAEAMVIGAASLRSSRGGRCRQRSMTHRDWRRPNDIGHVALAYAEVQNVHVHNRAGPAPGQYRCAGSLRASRKETCCS